MNATVSPPRGHLRNKWLAVVFAAMSALLTPAAGAGAQEPSREILTVRTIPPVAGVELQLDEQRAITGADGSVTFAAESRQGVAGRIQVLTHELSVNEGLRARYSRVFGSGGDSVQVAFDLDYAVNFSFVDRVGKVVEPGLIESVTLKSAVGERRVLERAGDTTWLHGSRVISSPSGPQVRSILWSIEGVSVSGTSVVHRAANRFEPAAGPVAPIELLFFSADFSVRDALLGNVAGNSIDLSFPDGEVRQYELGPDGTVRIDRLPRGEYRVVVNGSGPVLSRPVTITRDQAVELAFYTWNDVSLAALVLGICIGGPIELGRRLRRRQRSVEASSAAVPEDSTVLDLVTIDRAMSEEGRSRQAVSTNAPVSEDAGSDEVPRVVGRGQLAGAEYDLADRQWWEVSAVPVPPASLLSRLWGRRWVIAVFDELSGHCIAARVTGGKTEREIEAVIDEAVTARRGLDPTEPVVALIPNKLRGNPRLVMGDGRPSIELRTRYRSESDVATLQHWRRCVGHELERAIATGATEAIPPAVRAAMGAHNVVYPDTRLGALWATPAEPEPAQG